MRRVVAVVALAASAAFAWAAQATAAPAPQPYRGNGDAGGFHAILPPGQNGFATLADLIAGRTGGPLPPNSDNQMKPYVDLLYGYGSLDSSNLGQYFHDGSFGVRPGNVSRTYSPHPDVTVQRDELGIPHVYGSTRYATIFGLGYIGAEDRLFFMDALRHAGRAQLSSFAGGANVGMDADVWSISPYTEADLERQFNYTPPGMAAEADALRADVRAYVDGINEYISEARLNPLKMPGEYLALGKPLGPDDWKPTDVIATAALVGGIFGKGGGRELDSALVLEKARARFGGEKGFAVWSDFRSANDPEAPLTATEGRFVYQPNYPDQRGRALPDPGSVTKHDVVAGQSGSLPPLLPGLLGEGETNVGASNSLMVSGKESEGGRPVAVFGPQVSYFAPQILLEQDVHGPGIDARGAAFVGVNLYVLLGRGQDYAWSATSAGQDIIDTFAVPLCEAGGGSPTKQSMSYRFRGECRPIEVLERTNSWVPNLADDTPPGSVTLRAERTALGLVAGRGTVDGQPVIFTKLRSTYMHEAESALGFRDFNDPDKINGARSFQRAAENIGFTFNWMYADSEDIAYYNSGDNPARADRVAPDLPVSAEMEWKNYRPDVNEASYTPPEQHPQVINQPFITSWNNKQARGYRAADDKWGYGPTYRSVTLDERIRPLIKGEGRASLPELVQAMEDAASVDLRGHTALPYALDVIGPPAKLPSDRLRDAVGKLRAWANAGAHRRDANRDGVYEHSEAIRIMDAWWEPMMRAEFQPTLGKELFDAVAGMNTIDDSPSIHQGSAYNGGFYTYANKDLRTVLAFDKAAKASKKAKRKVTKRKTRKVRRKLARKAKRQRAPGARKVLTRKQIKVKAKRAGRKAGRRAARKARRRALSRVQGRYSQVYCGQGSLTGCRQALLDSLQASLDVNPYGENAGCGVGDAQMCFDAIESRPLGGISVPDMPWQNRPTYQQAVQVGGG